MADKAAIKPDNPPGESTGSEGISRSLNLKEKATGKEIHVRMT